MTRQRSVGEVAAALGWVAAAQRGDREAFARLYVQCRPAVAASIARRVADRHTVEDLTAATFCKAWAGLGCFTDRGMDPIRWLHTIARNTVLDHAKSARVAREVGVGHRVPEPRRDERTGASGGDPCGVVEARERRDRAVSALRRALAGVPDAQRQVLVGYDLDPARPPMRQVTAAMGRSRLAGIALRRRGLVELREYFAERGVTSSHQLLDPPDRALGSDDLSDTPAGDTALVRRLREALADAADGLDEEGS